MSKNVQQEKPKASKEVQDWLAEETELQKKRYRIIVGEMDALQPERARWIEAFLRIIQTKGYNVNGDARRVIAPEEVPEKPDRPGADRVVW